MGSQSHGNQGRLAGLVVAVGWTVSLGGILIGWLAYAGKRLGGDAVDPLAGLLGKAYQAMENKFYVDELYAATVQRLWKLAALLVAITDAFIAMIRELIVIVAHVCAYLLHNAGDRTIIDRWGFDGTCETLRESSNLVTAPQNGFLSGYLRWVALGALLFGILSIGGCS